MIIAGAKMGEGMVMKVLCFDVSSWDSVGLWFVQKISSKEYRVGMEMIHGLVHHFREHWHA